MVSTISGTKEETSARHPRGPGTNGIRIVASIQFALKLGFVLERLNSGENEIWKPLTGDIGGE